VFVLENRLRPEVEELIGDLAGSYELALTSGDNERERARFRELFGSTARVQFHQTPADKLAFVQELQEAGRRVIMMGDGLNDAGALKQADVGIAVVESVGAFSPASDVILDATQLSHLGDLLRFARQARQVVRWSFAISSAYNVVGVSIAAAGLLAPIICAILMPVSSLSVVLFACGMTRWMAGRSFGSTSRTNRDERMNGPESSKPLELVTLPEGGRP
jgi:Cu+-exporting ATPase